jgi:hypothetical protein
VIYFTHLDQLLLSERIFELGLYLVRNTNTSSGWLTMPIVMFLYYGSPKPKFEISSRMKTDDRQETPFTHNDNTALNATQSM